MPDRATLHQLIDSLPEEALEAALQVLDNYQKWPPKGHADTQSFLERARERFNKALEREVRQRGHGMIGGFGGGGSFDPRGHGHSSMSGWEGETSVKVTVHFFRGHELHTEERINLSEDKRRLLFCVQGKLPNGKAERHDFLFDLGEVGA